MQTITRLFIALVLIVAMAGLTGCAAQMNVKGGAAQAEPEKVSKHRKACEGGDMEGCAWLGWMYDKGDGVTKDREEAQKFFRKACKGGLSSVCMYVK